MAERTDSERVDWLDQPWVKVHRFPHFDWMSDRTDVHPDYSRKGIMSSLSLREAIDAAMDADAGGGEG